MKKLFLHHAKQQQLVLIFVALILCFTQSLADHVYVIRIRGHAPLAGHTDFQQSILSPHAEAYSTFLTSLHDTILEESLQQGTFEKLYSYTVLLNAFAVKLSDSIQIEALNAHPLVENIESDTKVETATTYTPEFLGLVNGAWGNSIHRPNQYTGNGVVIGILDTGIDPSHPSFSGSSFRLPKSWRGRCPSAPSFCNGKIVAARHFNKGINAAGYFNASNDFDSPLDGNGHGTHTSSIAAGNYGVPVNVSGHTYGLASGMAPRARLAVYKVIYRDGGYMSDVLAGIDQAIQDGVDVLSLSLGSTGSPSGVPFMNAFDIALLFAVKAGVTVVHAAGNNGPAPMSMNSFGPWVLSVAASTTDRSYSNPVILGNNQEFSGIGLSAGTPGKREYPLVYSKDAYIDDPTATFDPEYYSYCPDTLAFNKSIVEGKILICNAQHTFSDGDLAGINVVIETAKNLSAIGLLVIRPNPNSMEPVKANIPDPIPYAMPATFITNIDASLIILDYYNSNTERDDYNRVMHFGAYAWIKDSQDPTFTSEAPEVASYSSRGPIYANTENSVHSDVLKPDILAPGTQIWGAWTPEGIDAPGYKGERFAILSGTSMAAPHIAGIVAILKQKHKDWSNAAIRSAILTTASHVDNKGRQIRVQQRLSNSTVTHEVATAFDYGSGFVNASSAVDPGLIFDVGFQDYVNFLCTVPGADANSVEWATGGICHDEPGARSSDLNLPSITVGNLFGSRQVKRTVTSVGKRTETYNIQVHAPNGVEVTVEPQSFTLQKGESRSFIVTLKAIKTNQWFTFGSLVWTGDRGHVVRVPLVVFATFVSG